jgi:hypothetical protein
VATTGQNFVLTGGTSSVLVGSTVAANPQAVGLDSDSALDAMNAAPPGGSGVNSTFANDSATQVDKTILDLSLGTVPPGVGYNILAFGDFIGGYAKNGMLYITFTGTTAVNVDLTALATAVGVTSSQAGDTSLSNVGVLKIKNVSAVASNIAVSPGASNPARLPGAPLGGTSPTITLLPNDILIYQAAVQLAVDSTHKIITLTPTAAGAVCLWYGGS